MHHPSSTPTLAEDWQRCLESHTAASEMWSAQGKWAPRTVQPWLDDLAEKARDFKSKHGFEFDPRQPVAQPDEAIDEARDFDSSVAARTSHMLEEV